MIYKKCIWWKEEPDSPKFKSLYSAQKATAKKRAYTAYSSYAIRENNKGDYWYEIGFVQEIKNINDV